MIFGIVRTVKCRLWITDNFVVDCYEPYPSAWKRFWARNLLGWRWEKVK